MTEYESAVVATLQAEAQEAAMLTDTPEQYELLTNTLDDVDRSRSRWRVAGGTVAVAVVVLVIAFTTFDGANSAIPPATTVPTASASGGPVLPSTPSLSTEITGAWSTSMSVADVERTLAAAGLMKYRDKVFQILELEADPGEAGYRFQAYINQGFFRLYRVAADGTEVKIDERVFDLDGDLMTGTAARGEPQPEVLVMKVALDSPSMTFGWVADSGPAATPGVPNEALERVLYTTSTWVRSTT